jgi:uncharacterized lipoprotein YajG
MNTLILLLSLTLLAGCASTGDKVNVYPSLPSMQAPVNLYPGSGGHV